jgi:hypothetical protein
MTDALAEVDAAEAAAHAVEERFPLDVPQKGAALDARIAANVNFQFAATSALSDLLSEAQQKRANLLMLDQDELRRTLLKKPKPSFADLQAADAEVTRLKRLFDGSLKEFRAAYQMRDSRAEQVAAAKDRARAEAREKAEKDAAERRRIEATYPSRHGRFGRFSFR